jgi:hypothetical protein
VGIGAAGLVGLGINILPIIAETRVRPNGRMADGWVATQYIAGGLDVAGGTIVLATSNSEGLGPAIAVAPLAVGALWTTLAVIHDVKNTRLSKRPRTEPASVSFLRRLTPYAAPTRGDEGLVAGFSLRF